MSLIEMRTPASGWRAWKSFITACQIGAKPRAEVSTRTAQPLPPAGPSSTSRLPEPPTPTSTGAKAPTGRPPEKEKSRVSSPAGTSLIVNLLLPVSEAPGRPVQAAGGAHQVAHAACGQQV